MHNCEVVLGRGIICQECLIFLRGCYHPFLKYKQLHFRLARGLFGIKSNPHNKGATIFFLLRMGYTIGVRFPFLACSGAEFETGTCFLKLFFLGVGWGWGGGGVGVGWGRHKPLSSEHLIGHYGIGMVGIGFTG